MCLNNSIVSYIKLGSRGDLGISGSPGTDIKFDFCLFYSSFNSNLYLHIKYICLQVLRDKKASGVKQDLQDQEVKTKASRKAQEHL